MSRKCLDMSEMCLKTFGMCQNDFKRGFGRIKSNEIWGLKKTKFGPTPPVGPGHQDRLTVMTLELTSEKIES